MACESALRTSDTIVVVVVMLTDSVVVEDDIYEDEDCDACTYVEETGDGFRVTLDVPSVLFRYIIGKKGETRRRIEEETGTHVRIPRQGEEGAVGEPYVIPSQSSPTEA